MSVWVGNSHLDNEQRQLVKMLLSAIGKELELSSEDEIDQATAISGCGPAYVWYFMEKMIAAGREIGLSEEQSRLLTSQTFLGAVKLLEVTSESVTELRTKVASKGGCTEKALSIFDADNFEKIVKKAIRGAYDRAKEFGQ